MKFGLGPYELETWGSKNHADIYEEMIEQALIAEETAFDSVWITEGHFTEDGACPAATVAAVALGVKTEAIRICVSPVLPITHPVYIAEDLATVDNIAHGRLVLLPMKGDRQDEYAGYGVDYRERDGRYWESLEVILKSLAPGWFRHEGHYWKVPANLPENIYAEQFTHLSVTPKPPQLSLPVWIVPTNDDDIRRAAHMGLPIIPSTFDTLPELKRKLGVYRGETERIGRVSLGEIMPISREVYIADTVEKARADVEVPLGTQYVKYRDWGLIGDEDMSFDALARDRFIVGDVDTVIEEIQRYRHELGMNYLFCRMNFPGVPYKDVCYSIHLFGKAVISEFRQFRFPSGVRLRSLKDAPQNRYRPNSFSRLAEL